MIVSRPFTILAEGTLAAMIASDSAVRLLILCMLGYVLVKLFASLKRSLAASCRK